LNSAVNAPGGLPTHVDNALNGQSTGVDLETLFLEKNFHASQPYNGRVDLISHREKCSSANEFFFPTEGGFFLYNKGAKRGGWCVRSDPLVKLLVMLALGLMFWG
jgi:hypothetical protein